MPLVYDQKFWEDAADNSQMSWAKVGPGIYTQAFTVQPVSRGPPQASVPSRASPETNTHTGIRYQRGLVSKDLSSVK